MFWFVCCCCFGRPKVDFFFVHFAKFCSIFPVVSTSFLLASVSNHLLIFNQVQVAKSMGGFNQMVRNSMYGQSS